MGLGLGSGSQVRGNVRFRGGVRVKVGLEVRLQLWIREKKVHDLSGVFHFGQEFINYFKQKSQIHSPSISLITKIKELKYKYKYILNGLIVPKSQTYPYSYN